MSIEKQYTILTKIKSQIGIGKKYLFMSAHPDYQKMVDMQTSAMQDLENRTNDLLIKLGKK